MCLQVAANNVFRNMAAGVKNFYEDVLYEGVDVNVDTLKAAVKRCEVSSQQPYSVARFSTCISWKKVYLRFALWQGYASSTCLYMPYW